MQDSILNITVSGFRDYNTPTDPQPVNLLQWLTSNKYAVKVIAIRAEKDKAVRDMMKTSLPAITPSGEFTYRSARCLIAYSGFIQFDIDFKENSHITNYEDLKTEICKIENVAYCGLSVSGTGFWGLIPIAYPGKHKQHFDFIYNAFKSIGITIDKKPRNVAALRGYSYEESGYFNHDAKILEQYHKPQHKPLKAAYSSSGYSTQSQVEALINELTKKGIDITPNYNEWLNVGFALATEFAEGGKQYFHDVSRNYSNYDYRETEDQYKKCLSSNGTGITIKTFFHFCKVAGIQQPKPETKAKQNIGRVELRKNAQPDESFPVLKVEDISNIEESSPFKDFNNLIIACLKTREGKNYELLFIDSEEKTGLPYGEQKETVEKLGKAYNKNFKPILLDGSLLYHNTCPL